MTTITPTTTIKAVTPDEIRAALTEPGAYVLHCDPSDEIRAALTEPGAYVLHCDPLLKPLDLSPWIRPQTCPTCGKWAVRRTGVHFDHERICYEHGSFDPDEKPIIAVVCGNSPPGRVALLLEQCHACGIPIYLRQ